MHARCRPCMLKRPCDGAVTGLRASVPFLQPLSQAGCVHAQTLSAVAFLTTALSGLAAAVHALVLQLFGRDPHLPPCAPDQRVCAETYNLLLVL